MLSYWALEYYTLILFFVLGSIIATYYLKSIYFFSRVYSKAKVRLQSCRLSHGSTWPLNRTPPNPSMESESLREMLGYCYGVC